MNPSEFQRLMSLNVTFGFCPDWPVCNVTGFTLFNSSHAADWYVSAGDSPWLRGAIAAVYFAVSAVGLVGNATVLFLLHASGGAGKGAVDLFVRNLAVADLLFSAAVALWAVDTARDYRWPFGGCACKAACFLTSLNLFASVLFLAAMSVTRYLSVASALRGAGRREGEGRAARLAAALIWAGSVLAAAPKAAFAEVAEVGEDSVCLLHFPQGTFWLGLHHLLRVLLGFLFPYAVILLSYLLLLRFLCNHGDRARTRRRAQVSRSVAAVILAFCVCWLPNNLLTFWSLLVHLDAVGWSAAFYAAQAYAYPLSSCLAQANGCLNPVLYCLMRRDHRQALGGLLRGARIATASEGCLSALGRRRRRGHLACGSTTWGAIARAGAAPKHSPPPCTLPPCPPTPNHAPSP